MALPALRGNPTARLAGLACSLVASASCLGADIVGAASDEHLWFIIERNQPRTVVELAQHAATMGEDRYRAHMMLSTAPVALAAWRDRIWLVNGPTVQDGTPSRSVFTLQVVFNDALDVYFTEPSDRLGVLDPLPGLGRLASLVGTPEGPVALLVPRRQDEGRGVAMEMPGRSTNSLPAPRLLQHRRGSWEDVDLPANLPPGADLYLAAAGSSGRRLALLAGQPGETTSRVYERDEKGAWSGRDLSLPVARVVEFTRVEYMPAVALQGSGDDALELAYLLAGGLRSIGEIARPPGDWTLLGMTDGWRLISRTAEGEYRLQRIDLLNELASAPVTLRAQPPTSGKMWAMSLLVAITLTAVILVLFIRPGRTPVTLPANVLPVSAAGRLGGLVMDLVPSAVVTMLVLRCNLLDLMLLPLMTADIGKTGPYFLVSALTLAHTTISELLWRRSLGKWLTGAELVSLDGSPPPLGRVALRSMVAALLYLIPPLVVLGLLSPHVQGIHDQLGRIVVVRPLEEEEEADKKDR